jgi:hypothetical protein
MTSTLRIGIRYFSVSIRKSERTGVWSPTTSQIGCGTLHMTEKGTGCYLPLSTKRACDIFEMNCFLTNFARQGILLPSAPYSTVLPYSAFIGLCLLQELTVVISQDLVALFHFLGSSFYGAPPIFWTSLALNGGGQTHTIRSSTEKNDTRRTYNNMFSWLGCCSSRQQILLA